MLQIYRRDALDNGELRSLNHAHAQSCQQCWTPKEHNGSIPTKAGVANGENANLIVRRLSGVLISNGITGDALFGLEDFFDFPFAVGDVVVRTPDGSVFDEVAGLSERTIQNPAPQHGLGWTYFELSFGNWHYGDRRWGCRLA
jgi:hypothetical protein